MEKDTIHACIPNHEVLKIYRNKFDDWFQESMKSFHIREFYRAMEQGNTEQMENMLNDRFLISMSFYDTVEAFYHGVMLALMQLENSFLCTSNRESGKGRFDIQAKRKARKDLAFILEFMVSARASYMLKDATRAATQVKIRRYATELLRERYKKVVSYGISFCEKTCCVVQGETFT